MSVHENAVALTGELRGTPMLDHTSYGIRFFHLTLAVPRLSGVYDLLPLTCPETLSPELIADGQSLKASGQLRSFTMLDQEKSRLCLSVFVQDLLLRGIDETPPSNQARFSGRIARAPVLRRTPLGREICDFLLLCPRPHGRKVDALPCIAWGATAQALATLPPETQLRVEGRFQSRVYQKTLPDGQVQDRTAYEVSVTWFEPF